MNTSGWLRRIGPLTFIGATSLALANAQNAPLSPNAVWHGKEEKTLGTDLAARRDPGCVIDTNKSYTLAELIDLAEQHNPATRVAWETAKSRADALGIARSAFYPTMSAVVLGATIRQASLIGEYFHRQTLGLFEPVLHVEYLVFDLGGRTGAIDAAKANLLGADLAFNDTHRHIIFQVASAYYRLLNAEGQREAANVSLENAKAVEDDAGARLTNGLATKPDQMEAAAARAQSDYDLQSAIGAVEIAQGDLATAIGLPPETVFKVQGIDELKLPKDVAESVDEEMQLAFKQRPELLEQMARVRAASAAEKQARSTYFPAVSFRGDGGLARAYGQQDLLPGSYAQGEVWSTELELKWTLFDGARRGHEIAQAKADKKAAEAQIDALRDQISDEVWSAYSDMRTALRQQQAAAALLTASNQSYEAAHESYGYGVRNLLDVVSAQKALAQARSEDILARTRLLLQATDLAFRTGDLLQVQSRNQVP
ncbi:MAG TPA: TolC family protein [Terracidiphilus sp.]|jgi:outer membrane protein|nr:TolC family protein [Terracidiphilus sp.]